MLQHRQLDLCKSKDEKKNEIMYLCRRMKLCGFLLKKGFNYEKIIAEAESYAELIATEEDFKELDRRSIKMRYNSFRKGGKKYENNLPLIIELYSDCVLYNKSLEKNPIDVKGGEHLEPRQELDLSVFNKYLHVDADFQNGNTIEKTYTIEEMLDFSIASDVVA